ncbi:MAG: MBL fold metallo-hydrolase [Chloroflexi bacterium]|nr:MBL fold metallo-hydrolase [Chloroflexota bacterium]
MIIEFPGAPDRTYTVQIPTPSLGDYSYLVVSGDEAALVDPQLDIDRFERILADSGARLRWVFETHMHNDYVSGGKALAELHGAGYVLPAGCGATFDHSPISDGDSRPLGRCTLRAMHTPGHTPHHTSYVLELPARDGSNNDPDGGAAAVFSGGSMLVGAVGRTDLLGPHLAEELAHAQYRSVNKMADLLPDPTAVEPTHGAGSFCSATPAASESTSTIGVEKTRNPALTERDEDTFVAQQLAGYGMFPSYYAHMGPANRAGEALPDPVSPPRLTPHEVTDAAGPATLVDLRDPLVFAAGHVPGSVNVPMSVDAGAYIGWALPWNSDLVLVSDRPENIKDVQVQLHRMGVRSVVGVVDDGLAAWRAEGRPVASYRVATFRELAEERPGSVVDARDPLEVGGSTLPGAVNIHFSRVMDEMERIGPGTVWVHCQSGYRASIAASLLARADREVVLIADDLSNRVA